MRKTFGAVCAILLFSTIVAAGGYRPLWPTDAKFKDLAEANTTAYRTTSNATPIVAIRIDDGRDDLVSEAPGVGINPGDAGYRGTYWPYLNQQIPISLALSYDKLGTAGFATVADIVRIIAEFDSAGVAIEIVQHFDNSLNGAATMTWAQLQDECDPSELEADLGVDVRAAAFPGESTNFVRRQFGAIREILEDSGVEFFDSAFANSVRDSTSVLAWAYHNTAGTDPDFITAYSDRALYPGVTKDPYALPVVATIDLGNTWVERDATDGWGATRYDDFTILADGSTDPVADFKKSFRYRYSLMIANGWGGVWAVHDSAAAGSQGYTYNGEFSSHHVAWVMRQLVDGGFFRVGTVSEAYEWALSRWAPGTELVPDKFDFPSWSIGDTVGVELAWVPGWGGNAAGVGTWANLGSGNWIGGTNAKFDRSANYPTDLVNSSTLTGYRGKAGAFKHTTTSNGNRSFFIRGNLHPGMYELSLAKSGNKLTQVRDFRVVMAGKFAKLGKSFVASRAFADTLVTLRWESTDASLTHQADPHYITIPFVIDPAEAQRIVQWGSESDLTFGDNVATGQWEGGVYLYWAGNNNDLYSNVRLRYIGPVQ